MAFNLRVYIAKCALKIIAHFVVVSDKPKKTINSDTIYELIEHRIEENRIRTEENRIRR